MLWNDYYLHFCLSFLIAFVLSLIIKSRWIVFLVVMFIGMIKEYFWDYYLGHGSLEALDMYYNIIGLFVGLIFSSLLFYLLYSSETL